MSTFHKHLLSLAQQDFEQEEARWSSLKRESKNANELVNIIQTELERAEKSAVDMTKRFSESEFAKNCAKAVVSSLEDKDTVHICLYIKRVFKDNYIKTLETEVNQTLEMMKNDSECPVQIKDFNKYSPKTSEPCGSNVVAWEVEIPEEESIFSLWPQDNIHLSGHGGYVEITRSDIEYDDYLSTDCDDDDECTEKPAKRSKLE